MITASRNALSVETAVGALQFRKKEFREEDYPFSDLK